MKLLVLLVLTFLVCKSAADDPQQVCLEKTNLDKDGLYSVLTNEETPLNDKHGKFFLCLWQAVGVMKQDGSINLKRLQDFGETEIDRIRNVTDADRQQLEEKLSACNLKPLETLEHTAILIKNCHMKTVIDIF